MAGCLSLMSVCAGGGTVTTCPHAKTDVLACEQTLTDRVNTMLAPFNKTFSTIDLDNTTEAELLDEKTRDVVCSAANKEYVSCLVGNITACPELAGDADVISTWIASLIAPHLDIINSPQRVCEFFQDSVCSFREIRLNTCYSAIVGEVETENTNVDMCVANKSDHLTCMLELYRECKPYVNLTDNNNIATNIKVLMEENKWETFKTGAELCDCYEGKACYFELNRSVANATNTAASARDTYENIVELAEVLCSNVSRVKCAKKSQSQTCKNVLQDYPESSTEISVYNTAVDSICLTVNTTEFKANKECVTDRLTESYHPCLEKAKLPTPINNCRDYRKLYDCVKDALKGQCNADYIYTAYEMIRTSQQSVLACDVTSFASRIYTTFHTMLLLMFCVFVFLSK